MQCADCHTWMSAYLEEQLAVERRALLMEHLRHCLRCRTDLEAMQATMRGLQTMDAPVTPDLRAGVRAQLEMASWWEQLVSTMPVNIPIPARGLALGFVAVLMLALIGVTQLLPFAGKGVPLASIESDMGTHRDDDSTIILSRRVHSELPWNATRNQEVLVRNTAPTATTAQHTIPADVMRARLDHLKRTHLASVPPPSVIVQTAAGQVLAADPLGNVVSRADPAARRRTNVAETINEARAWQLAEAEDSDDMIFDDFAAVDVEEGEYNAMKRVALQAGVPTALRTEVREESRDVAFGYGFEAYDTAPVGSHEVHTLGVVQANQGVTSVAQPTRDSTRLPALPTAMRWRVTDPGAVVSHLSTWLEGIGGATIAAQQDYLFMQVPPVQYAALIAELKLFGQPLNPQHTPDPTTVAALSGHRDLLIHLYLLPE